MAATLGTALPAASAGPDPQDALHGLKLRHWSIEEGAPSRINAFAQTPDGFLWIGGVDGLFRFDGLSFERIGPRPSSPNRIVVARLLAARDGTLWIGLARKKGMLVWRDGRLEDSRMPNPSREVNDIAQGPDGAIWVSRGGRAERSLAHYRNGRWTELDTASGLPLEPVWNPLFAQDGTLWITTENGVYRKRPGASRFESTGIATVPRATLAQAADGTIWLTEKTQTRPIAKGETLLPRQAGFPSPFAIRTLFDRHGDFWAATWSDGAFHVDGLRPGRSAALHQLDTGNGLLSEPVRALFEDREGNIWIGGEMGVNMIRRVPVTPVAGIPSDPATNHMLAADRDGVVYIADDHALFRVKPDAQPTKVDTQARLIEAICAANAGGVWLIERGLASLVQDGRVTERVALPQSFAANSCAQDNQGRLWLPALQKGLWWVERGRPRLFPATDGTSALPGNVVAMADGRAAVHFRGKAPRIADLPFISLADTPGQSSAIEGLLPLANTLLTSSSAGLTAPLAANRLSLPADRYPWAGSLNGLAQTPGGETWGIGDMGLVRLRSAELRHALAHPGAAISHRVFDFRDGLSSFVQKSSGLQIVTGGDGRIWFATRGNVSSIDPARIARNGRPPDVIVRGIRTGPGAPLPSGAQLPAGTTHVEIDYTATSLAVPERVRFRHRLGGPDAPWVETTARTVAFDGLGPGIYRFELLAANEDGVWRKVPAIAEFTIARAFHQTWWFRIAAAIATAGLLYGIYALRLRQVAARIRSRMIARTSERERIARELHDTMIQGVQGLILRFQAVADRFAGDPEAQAVLVPALERAEEMLVEGRERVTGLRQQKRRDFLRELARNLADEIYPQDLLAPLVIQRTPRPITAALIDDVLAVLCEALNNAACHSRASRIEVGVRFGRFEFSAYVRDNGIGMSSEVLERGSPKGHFGVIGMRERMVSIGGRLRVESAEGFGTEVRLIVPAKLAYASGPSPRRSIGGA
ncbi:MAG: ligand-binding sensor domain-containing protein [Novosphingobium sp.]